MSFDPQEYLNNLSVTECKANPFLLLLSKSLLFNGPLGPIQVTSLWSLDIDVLDGMADELAQSIESYVPSHSFLDKTNPPKKNTTVDDNILRLECILQIIKVRQAEKNAMYYRQDLQSEIDEIQAYLDGATLPMDILIEYQRKPVEDHETRLAELKVLLRHVENS